MNTSSGRKSILLVEDEPVTARLTGEILQRHQYDILRASSGEEAIELLGASPVDLILMDIDLGEGRMDGTETARQILSRYDLPIVFHTSHAEKEMVERVQGITRYGYVLKNSGEFVLHESIRMAFQLFESHRKTRESEDRLLQITTNLEDVVYEYDPAEDRFLYVSPSYETVWERPLEEIYRQAGKLQESIHPDDLPAFLEAALREQKGEEFLDMQLRILTPEGRVKWIWSRNYPVLDREGDHYRTVGMSRDITREKVMEEELRKNSEEMTLMFNHTPVMMLLLDGKTRVRKANAFLEDFTGSPAEELIGMRAGEALRCVHHLTNPDGCGYGKECRTCRFRELILETFATGINHNRVEVPLLIESEGKQQRATFLVSTIRLSYLEKSLVLVTIVDITEIRETEKTLDDTTNKLQAIARNTREAICITQGGHLVFANPRMEDLTGYSMSEMLSRPFVEFIHPEDRSLVLDMYHRQLAGEEVPPSYEFRIQHRDGSIRTVQIRGTAFELKGQPATASLLMDVTKLRDQEDHIKRENERMGLVLSSMNVGLIIHNRDRTVAWVNDHMRRAFPGEDPVGKICYEFFEGRDSPCQECAVKKSFQTGDIHDVVSKNQKNGRWFYSIAHPMKNERGEVLQVLETVTEITEQKKSEEFLEKALREKDLLMKEINHRVKNNLSMISSMINLKAMEMGDERMFSDLESQIRAISIVHEILHQAGDVTRVDFEGYVQRLLETVFASFTHGTVHLDLDIQEVSFSSRTTVTLGLLVNEIATNAIKHGFTPGEQARFSLHLRREKENFILILSNSGRSFPEDVNLYNTETLGMSLISALSVRLRGTVELQKKPVTTFTITFPEE